MKAMILAAGLGTRLKPWTLEHPKALVPVGGVPMLERVILRLKEQAFSSIIVNVHHFADQVKEFLSVHDFGVKIVVSDESGRLLDTGGGILHAADYLCADAEPFLVHNVDILSDAPLAALMNHHVLSNAKATLLVSDRESTRKLVIDAADVLQGWHNPASDEWKPEGFTINTEYKEVAFSGIYVLSADVPMMMREQGFKDAFPIMDFFLRNVGSGAVKVMKADSLHLIDIGKPGSLARADALFRSC